MRELTLTGALLDPLLRDNPAGPRITYYDDATGERVELSTATLANWAAKTANLLRDELGAGQGTRVGVLLPAHWQTAAVLLGIWWIGAEAVLSGDADVTFCTRDRLDDAGMGVQMAEYVCHAVSRHFREFAAYETQARQGLWAQRTPPARAEFAVGILGLGVLGLHYDQHVSLPSFVIRSPTAWLARANFFRRHPPSFSRRLRPRRGAPATRTAAGTRRRAAWRCPPR